MKNHNIKFLIEQRKEGYEILGKMPWIGIRRYLTLPLETCLNLNKLWRRSIIFLLTKMIIVLEYTCSSAFNIKRRHQA